MKHNETIENLHTARILLQAFERYLPNTSIKELHIDADSIRFVISGHIFDYDFDLKSYAYYSYSAEMQEKLPQEIINILEIL